MGIIQQLNEEIQGFIDAKDPEELSSRFEHRIDLEQAGLKDNHRLAIEAARLTLFAKTMPVKAMLSFSTAAKEVLSELSSERTDARN